MVTADNREFFGMHENLFGVANLVVTSVYSEKEDFLEVIQKKILGNLTIRI